MSSEASPAAPSEPPARPSKEILSLQGVKCPACAKAVFFTDSYDDWEAHRAQFAQSEVLYVPGIDMGAWRPTLNLRVKGRVMRVTRKDLAGFSVFPILCPKCQRVFVAHLTIANAEEVRRYEEFVRPTMPPKRDGDEVVPKWGVQGFTPRAFLDELREIRNPMVKESVVRKMRAAGWEYLRVGERDIAIEEYVGQGPQEPEPQ